MLSYKWSFFTFSMISSIISYSILMCVPGLYTYTRAYMPELLFFGVVEVLKKSYFFFFVLHYINTKQTKSVFYHC